LSAIRAPRGLKAYLNFSEGIFATAVGVVTVFVAAVTVVIQLKDALNTVWEVDQPATSSLSSFARRYVVALAGVATMGFLLLVSLLITTALSALGDTFLGYFPEALFHLISLAMSVMVTATFFAMMFKCLPDEGVLA
jgi:membrane protein